MSVTNSTNYGSRTLDSPTVTSSDVLTWLWQGILIISGLVLAVLAFAWYKQHVRHRRDREHQAEREGLETAQRERQFAVPRELGVAQLNLKGWQADRRTQVDKETARLAGTDNDVVSANPSAAYVRVEETRPGRTGIALATYNDVTPVPRSIAPLVAR